MSQFPFVRKTPQSPGHARNLGHFPLKSLFPPPSPLFHFRSPPRPSPPTCLALLGQLLPLFQFSDCRLDASFSFLIFPSIEHNVPVSSCLDLLLFPLFFPPTNPYYFRWRCRSRWTVSLFPHASHAIGFPFELSPFSCRRSSSVFELIPEKRSTFRYGLEFCILFIFLGEGLFEI